MDSPVLQKECFVEYFLIQDIQLNVLSYHQKVYSAVSATNELLP